MTKNNEEILNEIYSGTKKGELMKKKKQLVESYLYKYGNLILECKLKPTPVIENLAKEFGLTGVGNVRRWVKEGKLKPFSKRKGKIEYKVSDLQELHRREQDYF